MTDPPFAFAGEFHRTTVSPASLSLRVSLVFYCDRCRDFIGTESALRFSSRLLDELSD